MTAIQKFINLGYEWDHNSVHISYYKKLSDGRFKVVFRFYYDEPSYICTKELVTVAEHKAITKQLDELGWL